MTSQIIGAAYLRRIIDDDLIIKIKGRAIYM